MIFSSPAPQCGQCCMSMSMTRLSSRAQPIRCGRAATVSASPPAAAAASLACPATSATSGPCPCGTTRARRLAFGASTPWNRMRCSRGRGTGARRAPFGRPGGQPLHELQRTHHPVRGAVAPRCLELQLQLPGGVELNPLVRQRRPGDGAAKLLQPPAVVGFDPHGGVQAEAVDVSAQGLARRGLARHCAPQGQHLLAGAGPESGILRAKSSAAEPCSTRVGTLHLTQGG